MCALVRVCGNDLPVPSHWEKGCSISGSGTVVLLLPLGVPLPGVGGRRIGGGGGIWLGWVWFGLAGTRALAPLPHGMGRWGGWVWSGSSALPCSVLLTLAAPWVCRTPEGVGGSGSTGYQGAPGAGRTCLFSRGQCVIGRSGGHRMAAPSGCLWSQDNSLFVVVQPSGHLCISIFVTERNMRFPGPHCSSMCCSSPLECLRAWQSPLHLLASDLAHSTLVSCPLPH